jgi:hypothetical protein
MLRLKKYQYCVITPSRAAELAASNTFKLYRPKNPAWIQVLAEAMRTGRFGPTQIILARLNGDLVLANGQNVLAACITAGTSFKASLSFFACETTDDFLRLYASIDRHLPHTARDLMCVAREAFSPELQAVPVKVLMLTGSARCVWGAATNPILRRKLSAAVGSPSWYSSTKPTC